MKRAVVAGRAAPALAGWRGLATGPNLSLLFLLLCCGLIGPLQAYTAVFSWAMLAVLLYNWKNDDFYLYSVIFLLFWEQFYLIPNTTPLYRVYSYLVLIRFFLDIGKAKFRPLFLPALAVFTLFCVFSAGRMSMRIGLNLLADSLLCYAILIQLRAKAQLMRRMMLVFALAAVLAGVYSLTAGTVVQYGSGVGAQTEIIRYYGTVGDANYAGCFFNAAIFMTLCCDSMKRWYVRLPLLAGLYFFLFLTGSLTGLICNAIGVAVYLLLRYRNRSLLPLGLYAAVAAIVLLTLLYVPGIESIGPLHTLSVRLQQAVQDLQWGDLSGLTTNRTTLWRIAWDYFAEQSVLRKLIGGSVVATVISEPFFLKAVGAIHQSYIQGVLDFGLLGAAIVFGARIFQTGMDFFCCISGREGELPVDLLRATVMCGYVFLLYAFTLDMFMDWRFLFLYFI